MKPEEEGFALWQAEQELLKKRALGRCFAELCYCGHLRSEHANRFAKGHGKCQQCECKQFTWKEFAKGVENAQQS